MLAFVKERGEVGQLLYYWMFQSSSVEFRLLLITLCYIIPHFSKYVKSQFYYVKYLYDYVKFLV